MSCADNWICLRREGRSHDKTDDGIRDEGQVQVEAAVPDSKCSSIDRVVGEKQKAVGEEMVEEVEEEEERDDSRRKKKSRDRGR